MTLNEILLIVAALLPAIILCVYVYRLDKVEKEPIWLLLKLFLFGAVCCFPAAYIEGILIEGIDLIFSGFSVKTPEGKVLMAKSTYYIYNFLKFFIGVALVEEGLKWITMNRVAGDKKDFNCLFDGMVYSVFTSLGFAALENVFYVLEYGWVNAFMRGVLSVPGHMFFAVMMGYHYSLSAILKKARNIEEELLSSGAISENSGMFDSSHSTKMSFIIPILAHTVYNFSCSVNMWWATVLFYGFVIFMYRHCFKKLKNMSAADTTHGNIVSYLIDKKYPELRQTDVDEILIETME